MGSQLALKSRIRSTESLAKIFNAQEMIASSHIAKARDVALNAKPYTDAIFDAVQALVAHTHITHPIAVKDEKNPRVAVLALTSDRGMAGPYTSSIIRETESLLSRLDAAGKQPELFVYGRRGSTYYKYRNRDIAATWEGDTDQPGVEIAETISNTLMDAYMKPAEKGGVSELYIVYTEFINMVVQKVRVLRMLPVEIVKNETKVVAYAKWSRRFQFRYRKNPVSFSAFLPQAMPRNMFLSRFSGKRNLRSPRRKFLFAAPPHPMRPTNWAKSR